MTGKKKKNHRVAALLASISPQKKGKDEGAGKKIENNIIRPQAGPPHSINGFLGDCPESF